MCDLVVADKAIAASFQSKIVMSFPFSILYLKSVGINAWIARPEGDKHRSCWDPVKREFWRFFAKMQNDYIIVMLSKVAFYTILRPLITILRYQQHKKPKHDKFLRAYYNMCKKDEYVLWSDCWQNDVILFTRSIVASFTISIPIPEISNIDNSKIQSNISQY